MAKSNIDVFLKFIAMNPPSIAILGGIILVALGGFLNNSGLSSNGMTIVIIGFLLQIGWLLTTYYSKKR